MPHAFEAAVLGARDFHELPTLSCAWHFVCTRGRADESHAAQSSRDEQTLRSRQR